MTWSYERNGLLIAHFLDRGADGTYELKTVDFDGFVQRETFADEPSALQKQVALERVLINRGWGLETFRRGGEYSSAPPHSVLAVGISFADARQLGGQLPVRSRPSDAADHEDRPTHADPM
ncbi:MAG: hypothetical protein LC791_20125 [Acidobacteria bacterium]|nr:hypothetical protein [Acidobacteriota bacterium]